MGLGIFLKRNEDIQPKLEPEILNEQMLKKEENGQNIYRGKSEPLDDHNTTRYGSDTYTLYEIFENGRKKGGDYLGYRKNGEGPYIFYTYEDIALKMTHIGSGYINLFGLKPPTPEEQGKDGVEPLIGIMMKNCPETITCTGEEDLKDKKNKENIENEPLTLKTEHLKYIVLCDNDLPYKEGTFDIDYEKIPETGKLKDVRKYYKALMDLGIEIVSLKKVEEAGKNNPLPHVPPTPETLYMICEYVSPEHIENIYCMSTLVAQCCVVGHTYASCLVGIVIPEFDELRKKLKRKSMDSVEDLVSIEEQRSSKLSFSTSSSSLNIADLTDKEVCEIEKIKNIILEDIRTIGKEQNLKGFEQVKDIAIISEPFTNDNGLLTPSDKNCRPAIKKLYQNTFNELFNKLDQNTKGNLL
ncbi:hypothetical protein PIROE2DRAFT_69019 [Piromyces sp. E2]|nr:hypothetical protein PIROE2DRAFT_69019 [Piromyces sp. E2]|eukprot:OUM65907.1 hypothetical protein PIROE2DRAFT_69019 [Piromyces sp. E2]